MKGTDKFSEKAAAKIRDTLYKLRDGILDKNQQKKLRDQLRALGFFISDYTATPGTFTVDEFDRLAGTGRITVH